MKLFDFSLLMRCCGPRIVVEEEKNGNTTKVDASAKTSFLCQPLEFEVEDYVLDLTYTQTLCW